MIRQTSRWRQWWQQNEAKRRAWPLDALGPFFYVPDAVAWTGEELSADLLSLPAEASH